jgi:hypothetical protein
MLLDSGGEQMRFHSIVLQAVLVVTLQSALSLACVRTIAAQQSTTTQLAKHEETDHARLSLPIVKAWSKIPAGSPVYALDDAVGAKDWLERSLIQIIPFQTGVWHVWIEPGHSVFRIYPYLSKGSPLPSVYRGIVLKVKGTLTVEDLVAAIRKRNPAIKIEEYEIFGAGR